MCNSNAEFELLWSFHYKKKGTLDLTSLVSTDNSLHGRSSTGSSDPTGPSQDPEKDSSTQSTEHLRHNTSSSWETRCTQNCQDHLVSRCHIACQEVSDFSSKGSLHWGMTIPLLEIWPAQFLCIACCIQDDYNTINKNLSSTFTGMLHKRSEISLLLLSSHFEEEEGGKVMIAVCSYLNPTLLFTKLPLPSYFNM